MYSRLLFWKSQSTQPQKPTMTDTYHTLNGQKASCGESQLSKKPKSASGNGNENDRASQLPKMHAETDPIPRKLAIRDFHTSHEADANYFPGPAKMAIVGDESPGLIALLLSRELSQGLQDALLAKRELRTTTVAIEQQRQNIHQKDQHTFVHLIRQEKQLRRLEKKAAQGNDLPENEHQTLKELQQEVHTLNNKRDDFVDQTEELNEGLKAVQDRWEYLQEAVDQTLDEVFVGCGILLPLGQLTNREELQHENGDSRQGTLMGSGIGGFLYPQDQQISGSMEQAERKVADKRSLYQHAYRDFEAHYDQHAYRYDVEFEAYAKSQTNRPDVDLRMEFDHIYLVKRSKLTRELIEAEEEFEAAKQEARANGCYWHDYDGYSQCADHPDDGYRESEEREMAADMDRDRDRIEKWILDHTGPYEDSTSTSTPTIDEWPIDSKRPFDSLSMVAEGVERKRIDRQARNLGHY
ncbi:uncharacterized protein BDZ99DRAFT_482824 [Mytilinidion resinicola]|uniref:Uncharacterized protein n=1 Tax=Mytilinidion resinicola TaxID=574789 RepID=A0A6A6Y2D8_9PEZI|nr:uncharacterized protein BDZ99DRAFT_482824 [Mytilinidion resinicola]KAF2802385.1 hypothetical protein BDZ99DRAFT_482824 [Mytilinidion resinicola]